MLDERIKKDLLNRYQVMQDRGGLLSKPQLDEYHATFRRHFGPDVLANLDGEALLTTMHDHGNRDSLVYWLEFKNDDEFPTMQFGSIAGGSALKLGIYKRNETGTWMTGSSQKQVELTVQEAIEVARRHRDQFLAGADMLRQLPRQADDDAYAKLEANLMRVAPSVADTSWGHKYFSLLFPDQLDQLHSASYQRYHLVKLLQEPPAANGRYVCAGRFVRTAGELSVPIYHLMWLLYERNREPRNYWRIGTSDGKQPRKWWEEMRDGGFVAVGWADVGDLSSIAYNQPSKNLVHQKVLMSYPEASQAAGRSAQQLFYFAALIGKSDVVLASDDTTTLGIGRVTGGYYFVAGSEFPHRRAVEWLSLDEWRPAKSKNLQTTLHQIRRYSDLIEIEQHLLEPVLPPPVVGPPPAPQPHPTYTLTQCAAETGFSEEELAGWVRAIERKGQAILYGPPGTGKTFVAERLARHLIGGGDGVYDLVQFHPAYAYEDFIQGIRPKTTAGGGLSYPTEPGRFLEFCAKAAGRQGRCVLIIDEINRANLARVFGELMYLLEYRNREAPLAGGGRLRIPTNVRLIGTMNTADRSIALVDHALRRRFAFLALYPRFDVLRDFHQRQNTGYPVEKLIKVLEGLNTAIDDRHYHVGITYFLREALAAEIADIWRMEIEPYLDEYFFDQPDKANAFRWEQVHAQLQTSPIVQGAS